MNAGDKPFSVRCLSPFLTLMLPKHGYIGAGNFHQDSSGFYVASEIMFVARKKRYDARPSKLDMTVCLLERLVWIVVRATFEISSSRVGMEFKAWI